MPPRYAWLINPKTKGSMKMVNHVSVPRSLYSQLTKEKVNGCSIIGFFLFL